MRRAAAVVSVLGAVAACGRFGAETATTSPNDAGPSSDGGGPAFCDTAPPHLFCSDFDHGSQIADEWSDHVEEPPNPEIDPPGTGTAEIAERADAPSGRHVGHFAEADHVSSCGYAWVRHFFEVSAKSIHISLDVKLTAIPDYGEGDKDAILYFSAKDAAGDKTENYLFVRRDHAFVYEQANASTASHDLPSAIPLSQWRHVEITLDASQRAAGVDVSGGPSLNRALWTFAQTPFDETFTVVTAGVGFACNTVGGDMDVDNVLITTE